MYNTFSPLEQFYILPFFTNTIFSTNNIFIVFLTLGFFFSIYILGVVKSFSLDGYLIPNRWQLFLETINLSVSSIIKDNIASANKQQFLPIVSCVFFLILSLNLFGSIPYTFAVTSELIITCSLSISIFIGIQIIAVLIHKIKFFSLFFPTGISIALSLLLVPIEIISFFFKPVSLSIRLFANIMAGHTLVKIMAGFAWTLTCVMSLALSTFLAVPVGLAIFTFVLTLEMGIVSIQAFVFAILFCVYLNDVLNLH